MHELALSRSILDTALTHAKGRRVLLVELSVGALRQVVPDSLEFYFEVISRGTACEGARLLTHPVPALLRCACGEQWELREPSFHCPRCSGGQVTVLSGEELSVESIEVEETPATDPPTSEPAR